MYAQAVLAGYSLDREAAAEAGRWRAEANSTRRWQRGRRERAERTAEAAERRALAAGLDWDRLPRPAVDLRAPDRSHRRRLGRLVPPADSPVPRGLGALLRRAVTRPSSAPPPPAATIPPDGGGVAAMAGSPVPGELTGPAALEWLASGPAPAHVNADGSAWHRAADGSLWLRDAQGRNYALAADGQSLLALSDEGLLYAQDDGGWRTSLADGTPLSLSGDGQLVGYRPDGTMKLLADDGLFYLVAPGAALYPIADNGDVLTNAGITPDGLPLDVDGSATSVDFDVAEGGEWLA
jgi:hypothetical protein